VPARGEFHAELTRVDFDRLLMQRVVEKLPRVLNVATHSKRAAIMFATDQSQPTIHVNGSALSQHGRSTSDSGSPYREAARLSSARASSRWPRCANTTTLTRIAGTWRGWSCKARSAHSIACSKRRAAR